MKIKVDRVESDYAVCEMPDGSMKNIPINDIPFETQEGDILELTESGAYFLENEKLEKQKKNFDRMNKLFSKNHLQ